MKNIIALDTDVNQNQAFCDLLIDNGFPACGVDTLDALNDSLAQRDCIGVFIDIDTVPITNRDIRQMSLKYPGIYYFCISKHRFHPELKDAICYHVYACLNRPIDPDELFYWIRSIYQDDQDKRNNHA